MICFALHLVRKPNQIKAGQKQGVIVRGVITSQPVFVGTASIKPPTVDDGMDGESNANDSIHRRPCRKWEWIRECNDSPRDEFETELSFKKNAFVPSSSAYCMHHCHTHPCVFFL
jgi:hypothetical protein